MVQLQAASKELELRLERTQEEQRAETRRLSERLRVAESSLSQKEGRCVELEEERLRLDLSFKQADAGAKQLKEQLEKKTSEVSEAICSVQRTRCTRYERIRVRWSANRLLMPLQLEALQVQLQQKQNELASVLRERGAMMGDMEGLRQQLQVSTSVTGSVPRQKFMLAMELCIAEEYVHAYAIHSAELERKLHLSESRYAELERSTDQWKARVEATEQQLKAVTADRGASCAFLLL